MTAMKRRDHAENNYISGSIASPYCNSDNIFKHCNLVPARTNSSLLKMGKGGKSHEEDEQEENMAAWLVGINTLKIQPLKLPPLGPHHVRIRMKAVGICGSDVHLFKEVGSEVKNLVPGDWVALEPGIGCWRCDLCKEGRYNLCPEWRLLSMPPVHGALARQVQIMHPADLCFRLPDNVSLVEGAMCEPLSVAVHACRRADISPETNVLIVGAGPIGLVTMLAARAFGAPRIIIVDVDEHRLSVAKDLGADGVIKDSSNMQDIPEEVETICKVMGAAVHVSFDCVAFSKTMSTALGATRAGGKVCLIGLGHNEVTIPLTPAAARSGKIDVKSLITHRFGFSQKEVEEAFETSARGGNAIKVMFKL
ncbi:hypothetical protein V6N11_032971 [Hibiscus sabdariffa]|uniref:Uncharacterized protein n=1 Tax=Hibiscus sabdariffa TaxID=183260 RepID=A0ABR1Z6Q1_9ROSI